MTKRLGASQSMANSGGQRARLTVARIAAALLASVVFASCGGQPPPSSPGETQAAKLASEAPPSLARPSLSPPVPGGPSLPVVDVGDSSACRLLTSEQLAGIFETASVETRPMPAAGWALSQCAWNTTSGGFFVGIGDKASITAMGDPGVTDAGDLLEVFKTQAADGTVDAIEGIGEGAAATEEAVAAVQGDTYVQVTSVGTPRSRLIEVLSLLVDQL